MSIKSQPCEHSWEQPGTSLCQTESIVNAQVQPCEQSWTLKYKLVKSAVSTHSVNSCKHTGSHTPCELLQTPGTVWWTVMITKVQLCRDMHDHPDATLWTQPKVAQTHVNTAVITSVNRKSCEHTCLGTALWTETNMLRFCFLFHMHLPDMTSTVNPLDPHAVADSCSEWLQPAAACPVFLSIVAFLLFFK